MINKRLNIGFLALIFFKIKLLGAQQVVTTSSNQGNPVSSVQPRFSDPGAMGLPNFSSGRFGNPTSNYPMNSFSPFGNQNNNMQRPEQGSGMGLQNENSNQGGYPYQGDDINPSPNYQRPQYRNNPNDRLIYPDQIPNQGNFQNRPIQGGYTNEEGYQRDNMNQYPNYQRPSYSYKPNDGSIYPENKNIPYGNENYNRPINGQGGAGQFQYPSQGGHYPSQGNFQGNGNPNIRPNQMNNFRPDELNNLPDTNIQFPDRPYQNQPNQYYPQNGLPYQNNQNFGQPNNFQPSTSNTNPNSNIQFPTNPPMGINVDPSMIQYPNSGISYPGRPNQVLVPGNFNNMPQNQPQLPNNQGMDSSIMGKPVIVSPTSPLPGQTVFDNSTENPIQKKCVQDCQTTSQYDPVCGSNNVTYFNPEKFACARNCGEMVYLRQKGRCDGDTANNFVS